MDEIGFPTKFLIDGIDRLGKSSLINMIQNELGYHLVIHYDKPRVLSSYLLDASLIKSAAPGESDYGNEYTSLPEQDLARRLYQEECNRIMFNLLTTSASIIFDRTHLGEMVYAPLYRNYSGEYVYQNETDLIEAKPFTLKDDVRMILLITSNFEMLQDDGLSFNFANKEEEQNRFIEAFHRSQLPNKVIVDVHNGNGGYKTFQEVFQEAIYKTT